MPAPAVPPETDVEWVEARLAARQIDADAVGGFGRRVTLRGLLASSHRHRRLVR
jgi:hypothetical protein